MRKKIEKSDTRLPNTFRQTEPDIRAYTVDDIQHALEVCDDDILALAINLSFACSLRMGEMLGLTLMFWAIYLSFF